MRIRIKDRNQERRLFLSRTVLTFIAVVALFGALVGRLVWLQIVNHQHYTTLSVGNRVRIQPVPPTRGLIYDRDGELLAENLPSFRLDIVPEEVPNLDRTIKRLSAIIHIDGRDIARFKRQMRHEHRFESIPIRYRLSARELARFSVDRSRFPGVEVRTNLTRYYPEGKNLAHIVGYVGAIDQQDLNRLDDSNYAGTTHVGKTGIEQRYETRLHGTVGYRKVEVTAEGRVVRVLDRKSPVPGGNIYLTIDSRLQKVARDALGKQYGAVVAIDTRTGGILAMVSTPSFDPNQFVDGIDPKTYTRLTHSPAKPLFNRAIRGRYPPGSTIKPFMGLAELQTGTVVGKNGEVDCKGVYHLPHTDSVYHGWKRWGHGWTDLKKAITQSCDIYFYHLAVAMGIQKMHDFLTRFGFGKRTGVDLDGERPGILPSPAWKRKKYGKPWYTGETVITGIGQGYMLITPLQLATATAIIADHGERLRPHLVKEFQNPVDHKLDPPADVKEPPVRLRHASYWSQITHDMQRVVGSIHGTAHNISHGLKYKVAGKTGTAQVFSSGGGDQEGEEKNLPKKLRDHALFIAFAPAEHPRIAVAVVVEHGGGGSVAAAPVARKVMDTYLIDETHAVR
ncbi:MAG TPA: penicillin-binding protein 2 [Gammaproteobacteria bacterium]|nr:penicillin-binding protein 2 [Gammaproteobacteria bacterium]